MALLRNSIAVGEIFRLGIEVANLRSRDEADTPSTSTSTRNRIRGRSTPTPRSSEQYRGGHEIRVCVSPGETVLFFCISAGNSLPAHCFLRIHQPLETKKLRTPTAVQYEVRSFRGNAERKAGSPATPRHMLYCRR